MSKQANKGKSNQIADQALQSSAQQKPSYSCSCLWQQLQIRVTLASRRLTHQVTRKVSEVTMDGAAHLNEACIGLR